MSVSFPNLALPTKEQYDRMVAFHEREKAVSRLQDQIPGRVFKAIKDTVLGNPFIPQVPTPKQAEFLALDCEEALYGGAAGPGKSSALLMAGLQYVHVPNYSAIIFRRTYQDLSLPGALMSRALEWLHNTDARWIDKDKQWKFPSGATLAFGYLENEQDKYRYQSAEFQFVGFDETTQFAQTQYLYLFSRLRRLKESQVPIRMRGATNPGGMGHDFIKERFIVNPETRVFIRGLLADNPHLDREQYEKSLAQLDYVTRKQLREGDWDVSPAGKLFNRKWFRVVEKAPEDIVTVRFWDMAATEDAPGKDPDYTVGVKLGKDRQGRIYVLDVVRHRESPATNEALIRQTAAADGKGTWIYMGEEPGSAGKGQIDHYRRNVLHGFVFLGHKETGDKATRAKPISTQAEGGNVYVVAGPWVGRFLSEVEQFPTKGVHDDQVDALSGAYDRLGLRLHDQVEPEDTRSLEEKVLAQRWEALKRKPQEDERDLYDYQ